MKTDLRKKQDSFHTSGVSNTRLSPTENRTYYILEISPHAYYCEFRHSMKIIVWIPNHRHRQNGGANSAFEPTPLHSSFVYYTEDFYYSVLFSVSWEGKAVCVYGSFVCGRRLSWRKTQKSSSVVNYLANARAFVSRRIIYERHTLAVLNLRPACRIRFRLYMVCSNSCHLIYEW